MCKLKRTLSIIICIVICVGLLTSCNNGGGSKPVFENGKYVPQEEMEITVWQTQGTDFTSKVLDDSIVKEWLENKTKVKVDNAYGNDGGQWDAKLTKLVAGNDLPEIVACGAYQGPAHFAKLDQLGQVWELTPEMLKKYAPNVWERVPEKYWNAIKVDGKILGIPYGASEISNKTHPKATEQELETMKTLYKTPYNDITIAGIQTLWVRDDILRKFYPDAMTYDEITKLLDKKGEPIGVAGCPPDGFSADGQLWGNPTYNWSVHKQTGYNWWIKRLTHCFKMYDVVRIDHFRGFDEFYSIPYGEKTARKGKWEKGPRKELFEAFESQCGKCDIIAEDLGFVTDTVREMVSDLGYPGMKILQFAFDSRDSGSVNDYLPHNYPVNCAAYTGTHDNSTLQGWLMSLPEKEMTLLRAYLCDFLTPREDLNLPVISLVMRSNAKYCIIPMQDWLNLDDSARMNKPSTLGGNWTWRIKNSDLSSELCKLIRTTTERYGRI